MTAFVYKNKNKTGAQRRGRVGALEYGALVGKVVVAELGVFPVSIDTVFQLGIWLERGWTGAPPPDQRADVLALAQLGLVLDHDHEQIAVLHVAHQILALPVQEGVVAPGPERVRVAALPTRQIERVDAKVGAVAVAELDVVLKVAHVLLEQVFFACLGGGRRHQPVEQMSVDRVD